MALHHHAKRGFTVPEILAVVAIIVIVISLLLPGLGQSKEVVRKTICASNLHQQGLSMIAYTVNTKYFPAAHARPRGVATIAIWPTRLRQFDTGQDVFYCPSAPRGFAWQPTNGTGAQYAVAADRQWGYIVGERLLNVHTVPFSYGYNDWGTFNCARSPQRGLGGDMNGPGDPTWGCLATELNKFKVVAPSNMIAITDNTNDGSWDFNIDPVVPAAEWPGKLHFLGANVLLVDGHVEWILQSDLVDVSTATEKGKAMRRRWNNHNKDTADQN